MSADAANQPAVRVLLAEDNPAYAQLLTIVLGMRDDVTLVAHAADGEQAVALAREHRPDVVLMDVHMPKLDGIAATRLIRRELGSVRVVMLTSSSDPGDVRRARDAGAADYLTKDCREAEIIGAVTGTSPADGAEPRLRWSSDWTRQRARGALPGALAQ